ncbi:MAG: alpha/beta hydrolase [Burkholderiales bacterium]|nr:alpha/beta hydrolase [Burkholderiales bacterium]
MNFIRPARAARLPLPGLDAHYLDWPGSDPPVLLLHPNRTNARVWDFVVDASALPNRFLAPDARGHGLSGYPERGYGYADYLDDLVHLLDRLAIPRVHLVGAATGGNLGLLLASAHPARVASLVVVDPGVSLDPELSRRVREQMVREFRFASLAEARARMPFSARWSEAMKDHYSAHSFRALDGGAVEWRYFPPGVVETEHLLETPIWDRIAVRCPTLAIRGAGSEVFPRANMERLCALIPGARGAEIDADHRVSQDNPRALAALIDRFVGAL